MALVLLTTVYGAVPKLVSWDQGQEGLEEPPQLGGKGSRKQGPKEQSRGFSSLRGAACRDLWAEREL